MAKEIINPKEVLRLGDSWLTRTYIQTRRAMPYHHAVVLGPREILSFLKKNGFPHDAKNMHYTYEETDRFGYHREDRDRDRSKPAADHNIDLTDLGQLIKRIVDIDVVRPETAISYSHWTFAAIADIYQRTDDTNQATTLVRLHARADYSYQYDSAPLSWNQSETWEYTRARTLQAGFEISRYADNATRDKIAQHSSLVIRADGHEFPGR